MEEIKDMMDCKLGLISEVPVYDKSVNYYKEFWRIYLKNEMIGAKLNKYLNEKNEILQQIVRIQVLSRLDRNTTKPQFSILIRTQFYDTSRAASATYDAQQYKSISHTR